MGDLHGMRKSAGFGVCVCAIWGFACEHMAYVIHWGAREHERHSLTHSIFSQPDLDVNTQGRKQAMLDSGFASVFLVSLMSVSIRDSDGKRIGSFLGL